MEQLIEFVRSHPVLYDTSNEDYMKNKLKDQIWDMIAKEMNLESGNVAKEQWKKLRDCHRDALKRQAKKKSGQGASSVRPWIYQKQMEFLLPFMTNRPTSSSLAPIQNNSEFQDETEIPVQEEVEIEEGLYDVNDEKNDDEVIQPRPKKNKSSTVNDVVLKTLEKMEKRAEARDALRKTLVDALRKSSMSQKTSENSNDPLYQFFMSMYNTTKQLPQSHQLAVRRKVFEAVTEAEEDVLISNIPLSP